jgi:ABC-type transport system involved in Fe-S cluster assembly, permease component
VKTENRSVEELANREYKYGFVTEIESESVPPGLTEDVVRLISAKKNEPEWLTEWRVKAFRHWTTMVEPHWANVRYDPIDYQAISYYSAPKNHKRPKSLDEVDPELLLTYEKLGIPLREREILAGSPSTPSSTASRSGRPTRGSSRSSGSSSAPSRRRSRATRTSSGSGSARSFPRRTTSSPP